MGILNTDSRHSIGRSPQKSLSRGFGAAAQRLESSRSCPGCASQCAPVIFHRQHIPVNCSNLWPTREAAQNCFTGPIELRACSQCGLVFNAKFDAELVEYDTKYDNSLDFSPAFQRYARDLAGRLIETYSLRGKRVVEIGCGNGTFLKTLCMKGNNQGFGYDPSFPGESNPVPGVHFVKEYFGQSAIAQGFDFLCCRHVLEHIERPLEFLKSLSHRSGGSRKAVFYFEVPNGGSVLAGAGCWDVIYPHVSYFTETALRNLFHQAGFEVLRASKSFGSQFLSIEARLAAPGNAAGRCHAAQEDEIGSFAPRFDQAVRNWSACLEELQADREPFAFWGAGAKGVTFLNLVPGASEILTVIDSNPRKQRMFVPGTGQRISAPDSLRGETLRTVILLNPVYRKEVESQLLNLGVSADVLTVAPTGKPTY